MPASPADIPVAVLWRETSHHADALPGFDRGRGHRVPDAITAGATAFLRRLAEAEVTRELEACHAALRAELGYKRRQLEVTVDPDAAAIATPDFALHLVVGQDPEDPGRALLRRTIQGVRRPSVLGAAAFASAFAEGFDGLDLSLAGPLDVGSLIDHLEEHEPPGWVLDYGFEATRLRLTHPSLALAVEVTAERVRLVGERPQAPRVLLEAAERALAAMGGPETLVPVLDR